MQILIFFFFFIFFNILGLLPSFLYAHIEEKKAPLEKRDLLSLPLLNFNTKVKSFTLGQTQQGEPYIEITSEGPFNAYQGRPYLREENVSIYQVASYIRNKPKKYFAFNLSLLEKSFSLSFTGHIGKAETDQSIRLVLPKEHSSYSILYSLAELQKLYTANPHLTLLFNILNYNVDGQNKEEETVPAFDRFNYLFYAEKGSTIKKKPSSFNDSRPPKVQISFRGVKHILVIPYGAPKQEIEPIEAFLNIWTKGADNFQVSPPNGYIYTKGTANNYVRYDIRFLSPTYNPETQELTFEGEFLENALTGKEIIPSILEKEQEFSSSFPCFVAIDWKT